jgi:chromosome segregation ATPase
MDVNKLDKRVTRAFSNVKKDMKLLKENSDEKFISKEDYVKLFAEVTQLRKEHNSLIKDLKDDLKNTTNSLNKRIDSEVKASNKLNKKLMKHVEKEKYKRSELRTALGLKNDVVAFRNEISDLKNKFMKKLEFNKFTLKIDRSLKEIDKRLDHLFNFGVEVEDVERNFIPRKEVNKEIHKQKQEMNKKISGVWSETNGLNDRISKQSKSIKSLEKTEKTRKNIEKTTNKKIDEQRQELTKKINNVWSETNELNSTIIKLSNSIKTLVNTNEMKKALEKVTDKKSFENELKKTENRFKDIQFSVENLQFKIKKAEGKKDLTKKEINKLDKDFEKVKEDLDKIKNNIVLKKEVEKLLEANTTKYQNLKKEIDELEERTSYLLKEAKKLDKLDEFVGRKDLDKLKEKLELNTDALSHISLKEKDLANITTQISKISKEVKDKSSKDEINKEIINLSSKINNLKKDIDEVEKFSKKVKTTTEPKKTVKKVVEKTKKVIVKAVKIKPKKKVIKNINNKPIKKTTKNKKGKRNKK